VDPVRASTAGVAVLCCELKNFKHIHYYCNSLLQKKDGCKIGFLLSCYQQLSFRDNSDATMLLAKQLLNQVSLLPGPLVLRIRSCHRIKPTVDRDRTVSQRSKPSSCIALVGEQPNPWNRFQLQDAISRHRGAKQLHR